MTTLIPVKPHRKATTKQVALLARLGMAESDASAMTAGEASETIDKLIKADQEALRKAAESINIDLIEFTGRYTSLSSETPTEYSGPCPKCQGTDRFHVKSDWWHCRKCYPHDNDKPHDAIAFAMWYWGCDYRRAVEILTDSSFPTPSIKTRPATKATEQTEEWQRKAMSAMQRAHDRLMDDNDQEAEAARRYLEIDRTLTPDSWVSYRLGFIPDAPLPGTWDDGKKERTHLGQPAITIPWFRGDRIVGIRYRFLQRHSYKDASGKDRTDESKSSRFGSDFGAMFGGQAFDGNIPELSTLVLCEGEINAVSIRQVSRRSHLDVLSMGSQTAHISPAMVDHARRYATVITWLDEEDYVRKTMAVLPNAFGIKSPGGADANKLLQQGQLGAFLAAVRFQAARSLYEQERLYHYLLDAVALPGGVDAGTMERIQVIGKALEKFAK